MLRIRNFFTTMVGLIALMGMIASPAEALVWTEWASFYNGPQDAIDGALDIALDAQGNVYVTGYCNSGQQIYSDYATIKYDSNGMRQWVALYDGFLHLGDQACAIAVDAGGNVYVTGSCDGNTSNFATVKYNALGTEQWVAIYDGPDNGDDDPVDLVLDSEGNVYVAGTEDGGFTNDDLVVIKYNPQGVQQWIVHYNSAPNLEDKAIALVIDADDNLYVTAWRWRETPSVSDFVTLKFNSSGVQQWVTVLDQSVSDYPYDLGVDSWGHVYVTGSIDGGSAAGQNICVVKYDSQGNQIWTSFYNSAIDESDYPAALAVDPSGNVLVVGHSDINPSSSSEDKAYVTVKFDSAGQLQWSSLFPSTAPGADGNVARALICDVEGNAYVTGVTDSNLRDFLTLKYNPGGILLWEAVYDGPNLIDEALAITTDEQGHVFIGGGGKTNWGYYLSPFNFETVKYGQDALPTVSLTLNPLNPPIIIPDSGGFFNFEVAVTNNDTLARTLEIWILAQAPNGYWTEAILGPVEATLPSGATLTRVRTQYVPAFAPAGTYLYECRAGEMGYYLWAKGNFQFQKLGNEVVSRTTGELSVAGWLTTDNEPTSSLTQMQNDLPVQHKPINLFVSPNPFNPTTAVSYELRAASFVSLRVYDTTGRLVQTLVAGWREAETHQITFDGTGLAAGVYLCRLTAGEFTSTGKMVLLK